MSYRVTYLGDGVVTNAMGSFQRHTTANTEDEALARSLAADTRWEVLDPTGSRIGAAPRVEPEPVMVGASDDQAVDDSSSFGKRKKHRSD